MTQQNLSASGQSSKHISVSSFCKQLLIRSLCLLAVCELAFQGVAAASEVRIRVALSPAGSFTAKTSDVAGGVQKGSDGSFSAKDIKVTLTALKTGISLRDEHMGDKLEVKKYPEALLKSATGKDGKGQAEIAIRGKVVKVNGTYLEKDNKLLAKFPMKISDLGIEEISYMAISVEDEVTVEVDLPIRADAQTAGK
jgi:hypothetical protein